MKTSKSNPNFLLTLAIVISILTAFAFQDSPKVNHQLQHIQYDTIPFDDKDNYINMNELDKAMLDLDKSINAINWDKISLEIESSLKSINMEKIKNDVALSLKSIDMDKIKADVSNSLKEIDTVTINLEIEKALNDVQEKFNSEKFKKDMEELKNTDMRKVQEELKNAKIEIKKHKGEMQHEMKKAKQEMMKAKGELSDFEEIESKMETDGLISKKEGFTIEYKNNELFINKKRQAAEVTEKYRKYFKGHTFTISRSKED